MRNFDKTVKKMYFSILFLANDDCKKCHLAYPKFMAASQPFLNDPQIFFGRVKDPLLFQAMNVTKFPTLVYYAPASAKPEISKQDLTVEGIITSIAKAMKGDFSRVKREYAVELTEDVYDEFVNLPGVYGLILVYKNKDAKDHIEIFEKIAGSFRNDYLITFGKVNAEVEKSLASDFTMSHFPGLYWYPLENKNSRKRYGGILDVMELVTFINDQTNLMRLPGGELEEFAGCIPQIDKLIVKYIKDIHDAKRLQPFIKILKRDYAQTDSGKYYLHIVSGIERIRSMDFLEDERGNVLKKLSARNISPIEIDELRRKQNILHKFIDELSVYMVNRDGISEFYDMPEKTIIHEEL